MDYFNIEDRNDAERIMEICPLDDEDSGGECSSSPLWYCQKCETRNCCCLFVVLVAIAHDSFQINLPLLLISPRLDRFHSVDFDCKAQQPTLTTPVALAIICFASMKWLTQYGSVDTARPLLILDGIDMCVATNYVCINLVTSKHDGVKPQFQNRRDWFQLNRMVTRCQDIQNDHIKVLRENKTSDIYGVYFCVKVLWIKCQRKVFIPWCNLARFVWH